MIKISRTKNQAKDFADIALKNRLYVSGWSMSQWYSVIKNKQEDAEVSLYYEEDRPIACCVKRENGMVGVFVRKPFRRKGIGSKLASKYKGCYAGRGIEGSEEFYNKVGIR